MKIRQLLAGAVLLGMTLSATAINRWFPVGTKRGEASFASYPKLIINGTERTAGPGLRIWNTEGRIQFRSDTKGDKVIINYTEDAYKYIDRIWILTPEEAAKPLKPGVL